MPLNGFRESSNFNRPPRIQPPRLKQQEFTLPSPPHSPTTTEQNWLMSLLPVLSLAALALFSVISFAQGTQSGPPTIVILALVAAIGAVMGPRLRQRYQLQRNHEAEVDYRIKLDNKRVRLHAARIAQLGALVDDYPAPDQWLRAVLTQSSNIWEKRSNEPDFMSIRIGLGAIPSVIHINLPATELDNSMMSAVVELGNEYRYLPNAPYVISLSKDVGISIFGKPSVVQKAVSAMLCQLSSMHAPQDLQIYLIAPFNHYDQWQWMSWLPHTSRNYQGASFDLMSFNPEATRHLMGKLGQIIDERKLRNQQRPLPHILLVVDGPNLLEDEAIFSTLLKEGDQYGASVICISSSYENSPSDCRAIIEFIDETRFVYSHTGISGDTFSGNQVDTVSLQDAEQIARGLADVSLHEIGESGRIPRKVDFLEMMGLNDIGRLNSELKRKWRRGGNEVLPFPVNIGRESLVATTQLKLDEQNHGPHGMLAGTTGSGKSELLQTLVTSLAIEHDPRYVSFLLVDFKGGATFDVFKNLPHTVGMVTDLDREGIERTLKALNSEIISREAFLKQKDSRNIAEYYHKFARSYSRVEETSFEPLPHLFVIVDELAQLAKQMPEFIQELVRIAQIGRSLGLHLILGTQSPMDVITEEMNANLQFRICLRVQNVEASRAMLRRPDAAYIPSDWRGRAYLQVGQQDVFTQFQTGYVGGLHGNEFDNSENTCEVLDPDGRTINVLELISMDSSGVTEGLEPNYIEAEYETIAKVICDEIVTYAFQNNVPKSKPILLAPLPKILNINSVFERHGISGGWNGKEWTPVTVIHGDTKIEVSPGRVPVGLLDDVENRVQVPLWVNFVPDQLTSDPSLYYGHVMAIGMPGSGKTIFLRTLALSLALTHSPERLHLYFISFSATEFNELGDLPQAERVIQGNDTSRVSKLFLRLRRILGERQTVIDRAEMQPIIILFIDQYEPFRDTYHETNHDDFEVLISEGRSVGIYVVFTANTPGAVPERIRSLVPQRVIFRLNEAIDYLTAVGQMFNSDELTPKGRCLWRHKPLFLCQIGIFEANSGDTVGQRERVGIGHKVSEINKGLSVTAQYSAERGGPLPLVELPTYYQLSDMLKSGSAMNASQQIITPIGRVDNDLISDFKLNWSEDGPHFVIVGPSGSGKSNALRVTVLAAAQLYPPDKIRFVIVDFGRSQGLTDLARLKHTVEHVRDIAGFSTLLQRLLSYSSQNPIENENSVQNIVALVIDDFEQLYDELQSYSPQAIDQVLELIRQRHSQIQLHIWVASHVERANDPIVRRLLVYGSGFGLIHKDSLQQINKRNMRLPSTLLPTGRSYVQIRNRVEVMQFAVVDTPTKYVDNINSLIWTNEAYAKWEQSRLISSSHSQDTPFQSVNNLPLVDGLDTDIDVLGLIDDLL